MQKCLLLAEGISFAGFLRHPITTQLNKPARYRGAFLSVWSIREKPKAWLSCNSSQKERLSRASSPAGEM